MFSRREKYWKNCAHDILAENDQEAAYLYQFLNMARLNEIDLDSIEIIDLRSYRLVKQQDKVAEMLKLFPAGSSFIFPVNVN